MVQYNFQTTVVMLTVTTSSTIGTMTDPGIDGTSGGSKAGARLYLQALELTFPSGKS